MGKDKDRTSVALHYHRRQALDFGLTTPQWKDYKFPTAPMTIQNLGKGTSSKGVGSAWLMGSRRFVGSPDDFSYQLTYSHFQTSTPNVWFALTHSRGSPKAFGGNFTGTIKQWYMVSKGEMESIGNIDEPLETVGPGTVRLYCLGPGSSKPYTGIPNFQGLGSNVGAGVMVGAELHFHVV